MGAVCTAIYPQRSACLYLNMSGLVGAEIEAPPSDGGLERTNVRYWPIANIVRTGPQTKLRPFHKLSLKRYDLRELSPGTACEDVISSSALAPQVCRRRCAPSKYP